jgi:hypothetical protein
MRILQHGVWGFLNGPVRDTLGICNLDHTSIDHDFRIQYDSEQLLCEK